MLAASTHQTDQPKPGVVMLLLVSKDSLIYFTVGASFYDLLSLQPHVVLVH